jgi:adenylate cyclase
VAVRELDRLRVPGKEEPIRIYEVMGRAGELSEDAQQRRTAFERALSLYRDQRWGEAEAAFDEILDRWPEDGPAIRYRTRAKDREGTTLPADWNGVHDMEK